MDIRHYRSFIALAGEGSFTAAARKLNIVQSGLSVTIKEMEEELGVKLVQRTTRQVSLTDAGRLFLEYARPAVSMLSEWCGSRSISKPYRARAHSTGHTPKLESLYRFADCSGQVQRKVP